MRQSPNIIITGTPGVGKTTHSEILAERTGLRHLSINQIVRDQECHEGWSERYQSWIVDEDKLLDVIEADAEAGGCIIDWHACDLFPHSWIDLVIVLRATSTTLYDRLKARNYTETKLQENLDTELMDVLIEEAQEAFDEETVIELMSNTSDEMDSNNFKRVFTICYPSLHLFASPPPDSCLAKSRETGPSIDPPACLPAPIASAATTPTVALSEGSKGSDRDENISYRGAFIYSRAC
ncbi:hypothetical protein XA68_11380 [Ophiocordyceps unilateralis]|uniref:Adenylate kinase isoenzyme 6 homolog n=1 Tax=Ophiocordyceps unilateralis TaxID=268505 RepID=A0A2A9NZD7_OPHUN|nr:hypothetical protein XA68_11380 [Ophiocordyceps unilateralis]